MAEALDQSQSSITRVMTRQQAPSGRLIENIAKTPGVNLEWLMRGIGEADSAWESIDIPVCTALQPKVPEKLSIAANSSYALTSRHYRPTRYWLRVTGDQPITRSPEEGVIAGDLLLMETDRTAFPEPSKLTQQLCGVNIGNSLKLAMVNSFEGDEEVGPSRIEADPFDLEIPPSDLVRRYIVEHRSGRAPTVSTVERVITNKGTTRDKTSEDLEPLLPRISFDQIACMCVLVHRPMSPYWDNK
ncbi:helix-turn-helix transcriptional regulator [Rubinisphaera sp.]|uniref:helix-turn-helix domain-containing protein n=1 Tax=Rubinisphaera sp. TaxID=2024857 RepID=UPI000C0DEE72|nr:helix-turn-helix transcriptional regulator [Rubinisphaera sp.]MBV08563.1 hypothetical protein [Rubinisphaera sp.]HCS50415.1 hypothetical protein [Planctomycetaceae bacterium]|tara:strand:+ start:17202 stop:17933 length:732 start_codon:yes stop_codon:yes gene_type:complete